MFDPDTILTAAGSAFVGAGFFSWMTRRYIIKVDQVLLEVAKLSGLIQGLGDLKADVRHCETRVTIAETKADAAHRRLDKIGLRP